MFERRSKVPNYQFILSMYQTEFLETLKKMQVREVEKRMHIDKIHRAMITQSVGDIYTQARKEKRPLTIAEVMYLSKIIKTYE